MKFGCGTAVMLMAAMCLFGSGPAIAGEQDEEDSIRSEKELRVESITVTAQKTEENVQEVPIAVTVFGSQGIEDRDIESINEIGDYVPNLMVFGVGGASNNNPVMRGISGALVSATTSVGLFVDGVPIVSQVAYDDNFIDVERVEVLRGPQGTLYGKNTETGVINIITRQPDNNYRIRAFAEGGRLLSGEAGNKLLGRLSLSLAGPLVKDRLFLGVSGMYEKRDGFMKNTVTGKTTNDLEHWYGRGTLRWTPVEELNVSLIVSRTKYDDGAPAMSYSKIGEAAFGIPPHKEREVSSNLEGYDKSVTESQALKITYDLGDSMTLTSVTSRRNYDDDAVIDYDFSQATIQHVYRANKYDKISQELRLNYTKAQLKWLIGFYYDRDDDDYKYKIVSDYPFIHGKANKNLTGDSYAFFGNAAYPLIGPLSLIAGLRYENQNKGLEDHLDGRKNDDSWSALTPRLGLEYQFMPSIMGYASASKGYRSGGFNMITANPQYYSFNEENLWNYEMGVKSAFFDNQLFVNATVFYMDIKDMQVEEAVSPYEVYLTNAADATGKGVELEVTALVYDGLTFTSGFGCSDVEFDSFQDALGDYKGNKNPFAPGYTFNVGAQYRHGSGFYARTDFIGYGRVYFDKANKYSRDPYQVVNAKIGYETEHFDAYIYGKNIFDVTYNSYGFYDGFFNLYSDPGEIGLQFVYRF